MVFKVGDIVKHKITGDSYVVLMDVDKYLYGKHTAIPTYMVAAREQLVVGAELELNRKAMRQWKNLRHEIGKRVEQEQSFYVRTSSINDARIVLGLIGYHCHVKTNNNDEITDKLRGVPLNTTQIDVGYIVGPGTAFINFAYAEECVTPFVEKVEGKREFKINI